MLRLFCEIGSFVKNLIDFAKGPNFWKFYKNTKILLLLQNNLYYRWSFAKCPISKLPESYLRILCNYFFLCSLSRCVRRCDRPSIYFHESLCSSQLTSCTLSDLVYSFLQSQKITKCCFCGIKSVVSKCSLSMGSKKIELFILGWPKLWL